MNTRSFTPRPRLVDLLGLGGAYLPMLISDPSAEVDADLQLALKLSEESYEKEQRRTRAISAAETALAAMRLAEEKEEMEGLLQDTRRAAKAEAKKKRTADMPCNQR